MKRTVDGRLVAPYRLRPGDSLVFADGRVVVAEHKKVYLVVPERGEPLPVVLRRKRAAIDCPAEVGSV